MWVGSSVSSRRGQEIRAEELAKTEKAEQFSMKKVEAESKL